MYTGAIFARQSVASFAKAVSFGPNEIGAVLACTLFKHVKHLVD